MTIEDEKKKGGLSLFAKHAVQYYIVGASGVLVNLGILYLLADIAGFWYVAAQTIAISVSIQQISFSTDIGHLAVMYRTREILSCISNSS